MVCGRGIEEEVDFIVGIGRGVFEGKALGLGPTPRRQVPANGVADGCREEYVPVQPYEVPTIGEIGDRLYVSAVLAHILVSLAQKRFFSERLCADRSEVRNPPR